MKTFIAMALAALALVGSAGASTISASNCFPGTELDPWGICRPISGS